MTLERHLKAGGHTNQATRELSNAVGYNANGITVCLHPFYLRLSDEEARQIGRLLVQSADNRKRFYGY